METGTPTHALCAANAGTATNSSQWLCERLSRNDVPQPADLIFVLAGKLERKRYGIELHRAGFAKRLLLSVGRFEVSKMPTLLLPFVPELMAKRDQTAPEQRHFFCHMDERGTRISTPNLQRWNTYGEALGKGIPGR